MDKKIEGVPGHPLGDVVLAKAIAEKLDAHYPGHLWAVHLNDESLGGVAIIRNLAISFMYGYVLKLSSIYADPSLSCVVTAGGEILERATMARGPWDGQYPAGADGVPQMRMLH